MTITHADRSDLPDILDLLSRARLPTEGLADHVSSALVAREKGRIVGCAALELYGTSALLRSVAVDQSIRGHGLGIRMTEAALALARDRNIEAVYLLTETAGDFFPKFGFEPTTRAEVPDAVQQSIEFRSVCPSSALVMVRKASDAG